MPSWKTPTGPWRHCPKIPTLKIYLDSTQSAVSWEASCSSGYPCYSSLLWEFFWGSLWLDALCTLHRGLLKAFAHHPVFPACSTPRVAMPLNTTANGNDVKPKLDKALLYAEFSIAPTSLGTKAPFPTAPKPHATYPLTPPPHVPALSPPLPHPLTSSAPATLAFKQTQDGVWVWGELCCLENSIFVVTLQMRSPFKLHFENQFLFSI